MNDFLSVLVPLVGFALVLALFGMMIRVCATDARRRGKSPLLVCLAVIFFFPLGLILWLLLRPEPLDPAPPTRPFRLEDYRVQ